MWIKSFILKLLAISGLIISIILIFSVINSITEEGLNNQYEQYQERKTTQIFCDTVLAEYPENIFYDIILICVDNKGWHILYPLGDKNRTEGHNVKSVTDSLRSLAIEEGIYNYKFDLDIK